MVNTITNALIAGIVGAVAWIAVHALVGGAIYGAGGNCSYNTSFCINPWGCTNSSNCTAFFAPTAGELMIHDILPLAIAIITVAGLFMGLTRVRGA